jgi:hypothetical protein
VFLQTLTDLSRPYQPCPNLSTTIFGQSKNSFFWLKTSDLRQQFLEGDLGFVGRSDQQPAELLGQRAAECFTGGEKYVLRCLRMSAIIHPDAPTCKTLKVH